MMIGIFLEIADKSSLDAFITEAKKVGMLKDISIDSFSDDVFPIRIPVNMDGVFKAAGNPVIKKVFGKKIEEKVKDLCLETINAG